MAALSLPCFPEVRIATWNVNSLSARLGKVWWWIERAQPDVLLLQETKLVDDAAPVEAFAERGYALAHHGQEGGRNGVAIASRVGVEHVVTNFGDSASAGTDRSDLSAEARMIAATCGGIRVGSVYVPNGRTLDSPHYVQKLEWLGRFARWLAEDNDPEQALVIGGDYNIAPTNRDVWDAGACHGGTHVSAREREALGALIEWGLVDTYRLKHDEPGRYSWWDYRHGAFHRGWGMRIDLLLATRNVADRVVWAEIDREARKGKPTPSDHTPVVIDLDEPGEPFDARWERADAKARAAKR